MIHQWLLYFTSHTHVCNKITENKNYHKFYKHKYMYTENHVHYNLVQVKFDSLNQGFFFTQTAIPWDFCSFSGEVFRRAGYVGGTAALGLGGSRGPPGDVSADCGSHPDTSELAKSNKCCCS